MKNKWRISKINNSWKMTRIEKDKIAVRDLNILEKIKFIFKGIMQKIIKQVFYELTMLLIHNNEITEDDLKEAEKKLVKVLGKTEKEWLEDLYVL